jgi:hypothetical protein
VVAYLLVQKFSLGVPHYRLEQHFDSFFEWVKTARHATTGRSLATKALGYAFVSEARTPFLKALAADAIVAG